MEVNISRRGSVVIWKRSIATVLGVGAVLVSLIAFTCPIKGVAFEAAVIGHVIMCSLGLAAVGMGIRFLRFAWSGNCLESSGWMRPLLLGIGFFFPGFIFSLPITMIWANYRRGCEAQSGSNGIEISFYIGIAAAVICCIMLLKKRKVQRMS